MSDPTFPERLSTARLDLNAYRRQDAAALAELVQANRELLRRNFHETVQRITSAAGAASFLEEAVAQWQGRKLFHYGIWSRETPALVGQLKLKNLNWEVPAAEISYFIDAGFQRRGYATEAVRAVLDEAFGRLGFQRIYARVIVSNKESADLARKLGMVHEGIHRQEFRCGYGELHDVEYFSMTRHEYPELS